MAATASNRLLVPREREHGQRNRYRHVDADLAGLDIALEARGGAAIAREDGDAVAVFVGVDELHGVVDGGDVNADEDGAEDFFGVAAHVGFDVCDYGGADLRVGCIMLVVLLLRFINWGLSGSGRGRGRGEREKLTDPIAVGVLFRVVAPSV